MHLDGRSSLLYHVESADCTTKTQKFELKAQRSL